MIRTPEQLLRFDGVLKNRVSHVYNVYRVFRSVVVFPDCMQNNFRFNISFSCFGKLTQEGYLFHEVVNSMGPPL